MKLIALSSFIALFLIASSPQKKSYDLVGTWVTEVTEFGSSATIMWEIAENGTQQFWLFYDDNTYECHKGTWHFRDGIIYESSQNCPKMWGKVDFLDNNHFNLTILHNCSSLYEGQNIVRKYKRYR
jgi:hypothetical protein